MKFPPVLVLVAMGLGALSACRSAATAPPIAATPATAPENLGAVTALPASYPLGAPARVYGTVVDAATGARVAGASIHAPGAERYGAAEPATSDAEGRFELLLPAGWTGPLIAEGEAGKARLMLRPLRPGSLEVVLRLVRDAR